MRERTVFRAASRPLSLTALGAVSLALAATVGPAISSTAATEDVSAIALLEARVIDIEDSQLVALSPDGGSIAVSRLAGPRAIELCIHDVATLEAHACADVSDLDAGLWVDSVVWSPDSEWLVFAELWPMSLIDGDLWLMDASAGELTNLLDDGYRGALESTAADDFSREGEITLPSHPMFTSDSTAVTFSRSLVEEGELTEVDLANVPITGGEVISLGGLEHGVPADIEYRGKRWTADGSRLFVTIVEYQTSGLGPDSGIWALEAGGGEPRQVLKSIAPEEWPPRILGVSPGGDHLLVLDPQSLSLVGHSYALVDGDSGAVESIEAWTPGASQSRPISGVMLSPDGSLLITVSGRDEKQVAVRDVAGGAERVLLTEPSGAAPSDLAGEVLTWAQNDTFLINGARHGRGTLIVLDRGS